MALTLDYTERSCSLFDRKPLAALCSDACKASAILLSADIAERNV